jgi:hypothetical protein
MKLRRGKTISGTYWTSGIFTWRREHFKHAHYMYVRDVFVIFADGTQIKKKKKKECEVLTIWDGNRVKRRNQ